MPAVDSKGRWGLPIVARLAEDEINSQAPSSLVAADLALFLDQGGCIFYGYPRSDWRALAGREADRETTVEVGLGLADPEADPHSPVRTVALALASRRPDDPFIHVVWYPDPPGPTTTGP